MCAVVLMVRDHPRIRGEHFRVLRPEGVLIGSSPHTRGAHVTTSALSAWIGIIPAYAGSTLASSRDSPASRDHPRIRGEHPPRWVQPDAYRGSSPHTRGAQALFLTELGDRRIIPAYAGSTWSRSTCRPSPRDHPRIRGEHMPLTRVRTMSSGSSPHTRGARAPPDHVQGHGWIIPAYAGSTLGRLSRAPTGTDHPRIRGEHIQKQSADSTGKGSSPHTRGAPRVESRRGILGGIIPAYAGSTVTSRVALPTEPDHPRIRGEHPPRWVQPAEYRGSSPHTRGARQGSRRPPAQARIIPAYAGSTAVARPASGSIADHPRIRGEHLMVSPPFFILRGSSPHTRGAPRRRPARLRRPGIIPAYAGSTGQATRASGAGKDHPRIRGEHSPSPTSPSAPAGSSPHTRGALSGGLTRPTGKRIIPAYAGSTTSSGSSSDRAADHPRIRGEHRQHARVQLAGDGSSPHTRGARRRPLGPPAPARIIPAYAGSTCSGRRRHPSYADHPRIRGEHRILPPGQTLPGGSSPHTRGAHLRRRRRHLCGRIIPAYAGST